MGWNFLPAQSLTLDSIAIDLSTFQKHYVYPSILRALGSQGNDSFSDLIRDVELVRILRVDSAFIEEHPSLRMNLSSDLEKEGYEAIGTFYDKKTQNDLFLLEKNNRIAGFVITSIEVNSMLIVELIGDLHINKLSDLMNMNLDNFSLILND
jgi:hypothetical protein